MPSVLVGPATAGADPAHVTVFGVGVVTTANVTVKAGGSPIVCVGDVVAPHSLHLAPITVSTGSSTVKINGRSVAMVGSVASCGGIVTTTPYPTVIIGA
tara:strand:+ start:569 stop:865 length:297 start_codon:yes stop_codon:yes gene_type:complete